MYSPALADRVTTMLVVWNVCTSLYLTHTHTHTHTLSPSCFLRYERRDRPPPRRGGYGGRGDYYEGDRGGFGGPRRPTDYDRRREDGPVERPRLQLQPRSKPKEDQPSSGNEALLIVLNLGTASRACTRAVHVTCLANASCGF